MDPASIAAIMTAIASIGGPVAASFFGSNPTNKFTGGQQQLQSDIMQALQGGGGNLGFLDPNFSFDQFNQQVGDPARQQFQQRTVPQIQQRFAGVGALRGTAAGDTITRAGADLEGQLAQQAFQAQQRGLDRAVSAFNPALQSQYTGDTQTNPFGALFGGIGAGAAQNFDLTQFLNALGFSSGNPNVAQGQGGTFGGGQRVQVG